MATATERIPVLVSAQEKAIIAKLAKDAHLSMGEFLRRAAASFRPAEDDKMLEGMIDQMAKTTAQASAAIDDALAFVEASNQRIAVMESRGKVS
jgi:mobilization protein NikA